MRILYPSKDVSSLYTLDYLPSGRRGSVTSVSPHSETQRVTWFVPDTRMMIIKGLYFEIIRRTVATTPGLVYIYFRLNNTNNQEFIIRMYHNVNTVNAVVNQYYPLELENMFSQGASISTADTSTGGTCDYLWYVYYGDLRKPN